MFEVEGRQVTLEELQNQAKLQGLDFDVYFNKLKSQKNVVEVSNVKRLTGFDDIDISEEQAEDEIGCLLYTSDAADE